MAAITARGDWTQTLSRYFAKGGGMEVREVGLQKMLARQGLTPDMDAKTVNTETGGETGA